MKPFIDYSTADLFKWVRAWGDLDKPAQDALAELERRSMREPAAPDCTHSQILRESGKCAVCGVRFRTWIVRL